MAPREITSTRLAKLPGAVVDEVLSEGTTLLTRSGRPVIALVPYAEHERAERERAELCSLVARLLRVAGAVPPATLASVEHLAFLVDTVELEQEAARTGDDR